MMVSAPQGIPLRVDFTGEPLMAVLEILKYPAPALRRKCSPVERITEQTAVLARAMLATMHDAPGVGLAAPQVGENVRLIVVDVSVGKDPKQVHFLVNPEIESASGERIVEEACLSLPGVTEKIRRRETVRVRALNLSGEEVVLDAREVLAFVLQHEIDHLDGKLILDHLNKTKRDLVKRRLKKQARAAS